MSKEHDKRLFDFKEWYKSQSVDSGDLTFIFAGQPPEKIDARTILREDEIKKIEIDEEIAEHDLQIVACVARSLASTFGGYPSHNMNTTHKLREYIFWAATHDVIHRDARRGYWLDGVVERMHAENNQSS